MPRVNSLATRWLGVGLAAVLAVVTLGLAVTGRLGLYINPDSTWFAVSMAIVVLVGTIMSFMLPLGAEADHPHPHLHTSLRDARSLGGRGPRHDHGDGPAGEVRVSQVPDAENLQSLDAITRSDPHRHAEHPRSPAAIVATAVGGVAASGVVLLTLVLPPASLSAELAMSRDVGAPPLFAGTDVVALATTGDTAQFGIGEWSAVFATATNPDAFDGTPVTLTGFVTPGGGDFQLTRLVITHCVIDAQSAGVPVISTEDVPETGQWVTVTGAVRSSSDGRLVVDAASIELIDEPQDPYEY